jgi:hypothetical protein
MAAPSLAPASGATGPSVIALVAAYNEEDVIGQVIADLVGQGVQVYLVDDGSTDATVARAEPWLGRGLLAVERRPAAATGSWAALLRRKEELARELPADWFLHHDADELRESPWEGITLRDAIGRVDRLGYDAIDFEVLDFWPTGEGDGFRPGDDLRTAFTHWAPSQAFNKPQVKAWKKNAAVELVTSGGHEARFPGRRVFPLRFLCRHYPLRGQAHGERKVFRDRQPRLGAEGRERGWHLQYEGLRPGERFVRDPATLTPYDAEAVRFGLLLRHRGVEELERAAGSAEREIGPVRRRAEEAEAGLIAAEGRAERLSRELDERNREAIRLGRELDERNQEVIRLGSELDERNREAIRLGRELDERNHDLDARNREAEALASRLAEREGELAATAGRLEAVLASRSWRWTAPLRRLGRGRGRR